MGCYYQAQVNSSFKPLRPLRGGSSFRQKQITFMLSWPYLFQDECFLWWCQTPLLSVRYNMWVRCGDTWNEKVQSSHSRHSFQGLIQKSGALTSWYVKNIKQFDRTAMLHTLTWKYIFRHAVLFSLKSIRLAGRPLCATLVLDLMCQIAWCKKEWIELKNTRFPSFESEFSEWV